MEVDLDVLSHLLKKRTNEIEVIVAGTGYLVKTVIGVGTFLLDNDGDLDLLTSKQQATFDKFLKPLLETAPPWLAAKD
jgi:predicted metal-dependent hydrolase